MDNRGNNNPRQNFNARDASRNPRYGSPQPRLFAPPFPPDFRPPPVNHPSYYPPPPPPYFPPPSDYIQYYLPSSPQMLRPPSNHPQPPVPPINPISLQTRVVNQIEYYFSHTNLIKDLYLRERMDRQGWVSLEVIAGFDRVRALTHNIQFITNSLQNSSAVEVEGSRVRKRYEWEAYVLPASFKITGL